MTSYQAKQLGLVNKGKYLKKVNKIIQTFLGSRAKLCTGSVGRKKSSLDFVI